MGATQSAFNTLQTMVITTGIYCWTSHNKSVPLPFDRVILRGILGSGDLSEHEPIILQLIEWFDALSEEKKEAILNFMLKKLQANETLKIVRPSVATITYDYTQKVTTMSGVIYYALKQTSTVFNDFIDDKHVKPQTDSADVFNTWFDGLDDKVRTNVLKFCFDKIVTDESESVRRPVPKSATAPTKEATPPTKEAAAPATKEAAPPTKKTTVKRAAAPSKKASVKRAPEKEAVVKPPTAPTPAPAKEPSVAKPSDKEPPVHESFNSSDDDESSDEPSIET